MGAAIEQIASGIVAIFGSLLFFFGAALALAYAPAPPPAQHWRRFNVLARVVGIWFMFGGIVFLGWSVYYRLHPEQTAALGTVSGSAVIDALIVGSFAVSAGLSLLLIRPYRPDLPHGARQMWWTGERKE